MSERLNIEEKLAVVNNYSQLSNSGYKSCWLDGSQTAAGEEEKIKGSMRRKKPLYRENPGCIYAKWMREKEATLAEITVYR